MMNQFWTFPHATRHNSLSQTNAGVYVLPFADCLVPIWFQDICNNMVTSASQQKQYVLYLIIQN